jgi:spermidine synthase
LGRGVGRIYAVNTIGAVLGAMLTGLALFSWIGLENIFRLLIVAYAAAGGALAFRFLGGGKWKWAGAAALILAAHLIGYRPLNPLAINLGFYMRNDIPPAFAETRRLADQYAPLFVGEGPHAMVTVREKGPSNLLPGQPHRSLAINGKVDASTNIDMLTQVLLGHLPMLLHPDPRDVFVVGLGSGVTAGAALTYGAQVDVAEISREVVAAERFFEEVNLQPLRNPRCRLIIEDAKTALRYEPKQYDVIISEPTNPWIAGVAGLFSVEFYRSVRARLRPGGVFAQWMPCYKTSDRTMAVTVATLLRSFPYVDVFQTMPSDFLFIAGDRPLGVDPDRLAARLARPETAADLARIHAVNPVSLLSTQLKGARRLRADFTGAEVNSDFRPLIEYRAPAALFFDDYSALLGGMDDRPFGDPELLLSKYLAQRPLTAADVRALIAFYPLPIYGGSAPVANGLLRLSRRFLGEDAPETQTIYAAVASASTRDAAAQAAMFALPASPTPLSVARRLELALQSYDATWQLWAPPPAEELTELADWLDRHGGNSTEARLQMARVFCSRGLKRACDEQTGKIEGALANDPAGAPALVAIAAARFECAERHWDFAAAEAQLEKLGQLGPQGLARRAELFVRFDRDRRAAAAEDRI